MQPDGTGGLARWTNAQGADESGLHASVERRDVTGSDLAVFASISDDVASEVGQTKSSLPTFNGILEFAFDAEQPPELTPSQAAHAATVFRRALRDALNEFSNTSTVHLFMAGPAGLAFLFGQQTNTLPSIQTYVLDTANGPRVYRSAITLR
jgi:kynureninase